MKYEQELRDKTLKEDGLDIWKRTFYTLFAKLGESE